MVRSHPDHQFSPITRLQFPWTSPTLGIQFSWMEEGLEVSYPDGTPFQDPETVMAERDQVTQERDQAIADREQANQERDRAFAKLRELGIDPAQL